MILGVIGGRKRRVGAVVRQLSRGIEGYGEVDGQRITPPGIVLLLVTTAPAPEVSWATLPAPSRADPVDGTPP